MNIFCSLSAEREHGRCNVSLRTRSMDVHDQCWIKIPGEIVLHFHATWKIMLCRSWVLPKCDNHAQRTVLGSIECFSAVTSVCFAFVFVYCLGLETQSGLSLPLPIPVWSILFIPCCVLCKRQFFSGRSLVLPSPSWSMHVQMVSAHQSTILLWLQPSL